MKKSLLLTPLLIISITLSLISQEFNEMAPIVGDKVNMRSKPTLGSKVVRQLALGELVITGKKGATTVIGGKRGRWVNVTTIRGNSQGWVFDYYLGYKSRFKRVWRCKAQKLVGWSTSTRTSGKLSTNGTFRGEIGNLTTNQGGKVVAYLYQYRKVYCLRVRHKTISENFFFIINKKGILTNKFHL